MPVTPKAASTPCTSSVESTLQSDGSTLGVPITTYRLAIGDKVNHTGENRFELARSGVEIIRIP